MLGWRAVVPLPTKDRGDPLGALFKNKQCVGAAGIEQQSCRSCLYPSWAAMGSGSHPVLETGTSMIPLGYLSASTGPAPSAKGWCLQDRQGPHSKILQEPHMLKTVSFC